MRLLKNGNKNKELKNELWRMIEFMIQIIGQIEKGKSTRKGSEKLVRTMNKWQCQIIKLNIYYDQEIQTDEEGDNVTVQSHLDDLMTFDPSNNPSKEEHQPNPFDILLERERMDSKGEAYLPYEEMSSRKLDSYYFRSD